MTLIHQLFDEEFVTFEGEYYRTRNATIYDRPDEPVPIYIAASGPAAARLAGRVGDGFICTSGKGEELYTETLLPALVRGLRQGRARPRQHRPDDRDEGQLRHRPRAGDGGHQGLVRPRADRASRRWASRTRARWSAWPRASRTIAYRRWLVSDDPDEHVEQIATYVGYGFDHLVFHFPGKDQEAAIARYGELILPRLRARFG